MDYAEDLRGLLRPLGIYDVDSGIGGAELGAIGDALTENFTLLETAEREASPMTAEDTGLATWESLLPFVPHWITLADRRRAIPEHRPHPATAAPFAWPESPQTPEDPRRCPPRASALLLL